MGVQITDYKNILLSGVVIM